MQFTPQEMKSIERLRKQERLWPRTRWLVLGSAAFILAVYGFMTWQMVVMLDSPEFEFFDATSMLIAVEWPKCLLAFCVAFWIIAVVIRDWHGNVNRMLLLRLLDDRQKEASKDENAA